MEIVSSADKLVIQLTSAQVFLRFCCDDEVMNSIVDQAGLPFPFAYQILSAHIQITINY